MRETFAARVQVDDLLRVGEVGQQVALDAEGDGSGGGDGDLVQQVGVRLVAQAVGAGTDRGPGVESWFARPLVGAKAWASIWRRASTAWPSELT